MTHWFSSFSVVRKSSMANTHTLHLHPEKQKCTLLSLSKTGTKEYPRGHGWILVPFAQQHREAAPFLQEPSTGDRELPRSLRGWCLCPWGKGFPGALEKGGGGVECEEAVLLT